MSPATHRQIEIALVIDELHEAVDTIVAGANEREDLMQELLREAEKDDPAEELRGWNNAEQVAFRREVYGQTLYRALFVVAWATLEQLLNKLCEDLREDRGLRLKVNQLAGSGVRRSMLYLQKAIGIEIDLNRWGWEEILTYGTLRNHLVHVGPNLHDGPDPVGVRKKLLHLPELKIEPAGELVLSAEFVRTAIGSAQRLLHGVVQSVSDGSSESEIQPAAGL